MRTYPWCEPQRSICLPKRTRSALSNHVRAPRPWGVAHELQRSTGDIGAGVRSFSSCKPVAPKALWVSRIRTRNGLTPSLARHRESLENISNAGVARNLAAYLPVSRAHRTLCWPSTSSINESPIKPSTIGLNTRYPTSPVNSLPASSDTPTHHEAQDFVPQKVR